MYEVILAITYRGAVVGSTRDVIEADDAEQAEQKAIALWRAEWPDRAFAPLLTLSRQA